MVAGGCERAFKTFEKIQCTRETTVIIISKIMSAVKFGTMALRPKPVKSHKSKKGPPKNALSSAK